MNHTSRMAALLGELRRERNGAVADAMAFYGTKYGLNYGVSLPTLRRLARAEGTDNEFARYLYQQQVRELQLAAFYLADAKALQPSDFDFWAVGILNSEVAEEAAFAFFSRADVLPELFAAWIGRDNPLLVYTALMSAARFSKPDSTWIAPTILAVKRFDAVKEPAYASHLIPQGAVALLAAIAAQSDAARKAVLGAISVFSEEHVLRQELPWRLGVE